MRYYVIGQDGSRYGPAEIPLIQQWVSEGRVSATSILEEEVSGQRIPASEVLSLGQSPAPPVAQPQWQTPTGAPSYPGGALVNTSGQGPTAAVPPEIRGWSWAAFLGSWIWAIAHSTWLGLIALVPYAGWIMCFVLGVKGNEWAWQNRRWESVEQFRAVQKIWTYWVVALTIIGVIFGVIGAVVSVLGTSFQ